MISIYQLKSRFQDMLRPLCNAVARKGVTANQVTLAAAGLSVGYAALLCFNVSVFWLFLPVVLFVRMGMNAIDGMLAKEHGMKSRLGMALNEIGDVVSDTALAIPFIVYAPQGAWMVGLFILMAILSEFCGVLAFMMSGERRYDGPMGKSDRALAMGGVGVLIGVDMMPDFLIPFVFLLLSLLTLWSCRNRIERALEGRDDQGNYSHLE